MGVKPLLRLHREKSQRALYTVAMRGSACCCSSLQIADITSGSKKQRRDSMKGHARPGKIGLSGRKPKRDSRNNVPEYLCNHSLPGKLAPAPPDPPST